jgi:hypothetical protein
VCALRGAGPGQGERRVHGILYANVSHDMSVVKCMCSCLRSCRATHVVCRGSCARIPVAYLASAFECDVRSWTWFYIFVIPFLAVSAFDSGLSHTQAFSSHSHVSQDQHHDAPDPGLRRRDSPTPVTYASVVSVSHVAVRCWTLSSTLCGANALVSGPLKRPVRSPHSQQVRDPAGGLSATGAPVLSFGRGCCSMEPAHCGDLARKLHF